MLQEIKDEVLSGDPRYTIRDDNGNIIQDNVDIELKTPIVQPGTPLNKATLGNMQGDLYTADRYNKPVVTYDGTNYINNLSLPLASYEVGKIVNIEGQKYILAEPDYTEEEFTSSIIPIFTSNDDITNNYGTWRIAADYSSGGNAYNLFDGNDSTYWYAYKNEKEYKASVWSVEDENYRSFAIKPTEITINARYHKNIRIIGITPEGISEVIGTIPENSSTTATTSTITISPNNYYTRFDFIVASYGTGGHAYVYSIAITKGSIRYGIVNEKNVISFVNPYLNINNLGAKQINGTIEAGEKYSLVFNGESWDIIKDYVVGTYTGNNLSSQFIELGFTPSAVFVTNAMGATYDEGGSSYDLYFGGLAINGYPTKGNSAKIVEIVENGFKVYYGDSGTYLPYANSSSTLYNPFRYIAFK